jgi:septal ring factor EnvC (AmiA/AmiB activator)
MTTQENLILTPTAPGELIDKITVLKIKEERIKDEARLLNVRKELLMLEETREKSFTKSNQVINKLAKLEADLKKSNEEIWDMGDKIRELGDKQDFGKDFIDVAYGIHLANDKRAAIKKEINLMLGSSIVEEKSYKHWK